MRLTRDDFRAAALAGEPGYQTIRWTTKRSVSIKREHDDYRHLSLKTHVMRISVRLVASLVLAAVCTTALADPPAHAPAHGWRKKHDPQYVGYSGDRWENDYEVSTGRCNREQIGAVLGGVAGGIVGSKVASPDNRIVGTIIGAAAGALIGSRIGRELDEGDRGCFGHALEITQPGGRVEWANRATGVSYVLIPGSGRKERSGMCRTFTLEATGRGGALRKAHRTGLPGKSRRLEIELSVNAGDAAERRHGILRRTYGICIHSSGS